MIGFFVQLIVPLALMFYRFPRKKHFWLLFLPQLAVELTISILFAKPESLFFLPEGEKPEKFRDEVFRRMDRMVELAAKENLILLHENEKEIYGDIASRCLDLMENFGGANLKATFDFANFVQCGQNTLEAYDMLKDHIAYVHVKDALFDGGCVVPAGQGDGNLKAILARLDGEGYEGFLSLEPHLADFAGLSGLEKNAAVRGRTDTEAAFVTAYEALQALLHG